MTKGSVELLATFHGRSFPIRKDENIINIKDVCHVMQYFLYIVTVFSRGWILSGVCLETSAVESLPVFIKKSVDSDKLYSHSISFTFLNEEIDTFYYFVL